MTGELNQYEKTLELLNKDIVNLSHQYGEASRRVELLLEKNKRLEKVIAASQIRQGARMHRADLSVLQW